MNLKARTITFIIFISIPLFLFAQETSLSKEEIIKIFKSHYHSIKPLFHTPFELYEAKSFNLAREIEKKNMPSEMIDEMMEVLSSNAELSIEQGGNRVVLNTRYPDGFPKRMEDAILWIDIEAIPSKSKLTDQNDKEVKFRNFTFGNVTRGVHQEPIDGMDETITRQNKFLSIRVEEQCNFVGENWEVAEPFEGSVTYQVIFETEFPHIKLAKNDIGVTFQLGDKQYRLTDVFDNKVVLEPIDYDKAKYRSAKSIELFNLEEDGKAQRVRMSKKRIGELPEDDIKNQYQKSYNGWLTRTIYKPMFDLFKVNPNISFDEFQTIISADIFYQKDAQYIILISPAPIEHDFIIVHPISEVKREFTVGY